MKLNLYFFVQLEFIVENTKIDLNEIHHEIK